MSPDRRPRTAASRVLGLLALALALAVVTAAAPAAAARSSRAGGLPARARQAEAGLPVLRFGVRLVDVPADEAGNPRALQYITDSLPTGSVIRRRIMIINEERRTARFAVYPGAARVAGGSFIGGAGRARNELTGWVTVQHPSLVLGPGQSAMDLVTVRVPLDATRGEHYGVIWAEQAAAVRAGKDVSIRDVARAGIRVYLAVGRGGAPPTRFAITSISGQEPAAGPPRFVARVDNTGGRAVDLAGELRLAAGPGGSSAGPFAAGHVLTLAPGQSGDVIFPLPAALPAGPWAVTVTLVSGLTTATARATVTLGGQPASASWADPVTLAWAGGMLLGLLVIAAAAIARLRRPRRALV
jgi:hypothetical protein